MLVNKLNFSQLLLIKGHQPLFKNSVFNIVLNSQVPKLQVVAQKTHYN